MLHRKELAELRRYRTEEAAGLLLRLPVPLGTTVWRGIILPAITECDRRKYFCLGGWRHPGRLLSLYRSHWPCWMSGGAPHSRPKLRGGRF